MFSLAVEVCNIQTLKWTLTEGKSEITSKFFSTVISVFPLLPSREGHSQMGDVRTLSSELSSASLLSDAVSPGIPAFQRQHHQGRGKTREEGAQHRSLSPLGWGSSLPPATVGKQASFVCILRPQKCKNRKTGDVAVGRGSRRVLTDKTGTSSW